MSLCNQLFLFYFLFEKSTLILYIINITGLSQFKHMHVQKVILLIFLHLISKVSSE